MPNLENLKKQAKLHLRWHRDGYYPVAAQIRLTLPRFGRFSDVEILNQPLRLEPWGARTFILRDPDDNLILIAGPAG